MDLKVVLGIDPSLRGTGLCSFDIYEKFAVMDRVYYEDPMEKTFANVYKRSVEIFENISYFIKNYPPDLILMESPLPVGQMVGGLSLLAGLLADRLLEEFGKILLVHPSYIKYILKKRSYKKSELVDYVKKVLEEEKFGFTPKRFSVDEAVAFNLCYRGGILLGYKPNKIRQRFTVKKEILLKRDTEPCQKLHLQRLTTELKELKT